MRRPRNDEMTRVWLKKLREKQKRGVKIKWAWIQLGSDGEAKRETKGWHEERERERERNEATRRAGLESKKRGKVTTRCKKASEG